ncbi:hypothetical protein JYU34_007904 [Plutella xylostella]|uniref:Uncharacterized protein n=1 Tax=Plutella xylostella TaxID=51655 RepID=A0ABQ7QNC5_PLUXY|nr:hypothetical protein JYU34_007904 [Plutella xylostella]
MRLFWLVTCLFCVVNSRESRKSSGSKSPASVNLAFETFLKFGDEDRARGLNVLDHIQGLITKLKGAVAAPQVHKKSEVNERKHLSDYVKKAIKLLITFSDKDLETVAKVALNEIGGCSGDVCSISELDDDDPVKEAFSRLQRQVKGATGKQIRAALKKILHKLEHDTGDKNKEFIKYTDDIYRTLDKGKLKKFISQLHMFKTRRSGSLKDIVKENLRRAVLEPYSTLGDKTRRDIVMKLNTFWRQTASINIPTKLHDKQPQLGDTTESAQKGADKNDHDNETMLFSSTQEGPRETPTTTTTAEGVMTHELGAVINIVKDIKFSARVRSFKEDPKKEHPHGDQTQKGTDAAAAIVPAADSLSDSDETYRRTLDTDSKEDATKEDKTLSVEWLAESSPKNINDDAEDTTPLQTSGNRRNIFFHGAEDSMPNSVGEGDKEKRTTLQGVDDENEVKKEIT